MSEPQTETSTPEETPVEQPAVQETPEPTPDVPAPDETPTETPQEAPEPATEDEPDETPDDPDEPPETPSAPQASEKELEKASRSLERSVATYHEAVKRYLSVTGEKLFRDPVSNDKFPGYFYNPDDVPLDEGQQIAMRHLLGMQLMPTLRKDPLSHRCDTCDGHGSVDTDSQVDGERFVICPICEGHGFNGERLERIKRAGHSQAAVPQAVADSPGLYAAPVDTWGTPLGHPGFGTPPDKWLAQWFDVPGAAHSHATVNSGV